MPYYINDKVVRTLPEQVAQNQEDIESLAAAQDDDHSLINTNTNDIAALTTRVTSCETINLKVKDGTAINLNRSNKADMGTIPVKTIGGISLIDGAADNIPVATINGESVLQDKNFVFDASLTTLIMANLGIGRWANQNLYSTNWTGGEGTLYDNLSDTYTSLIRYLDGATFYNYNYTGKLEPVSVIHLPTFNVTTEDAIYDFMFANMGNTGTLELNSISIRTAQNTFASSKFSKILVKDGATVDMWDGCANAFAYCSNLTEIGAINMCHTNKAGSKVYAQDGAAWYRPMFIGCTKLKSIHCTHWGLSFNISYSTAFEEADLVEIISNLDVVGTTQTLTMGTTNLAKLTNEEISVATGKGWILA